MSRTALITGCATGIGRALATELARRGYVVFATDPDAAAIADLSAETIHTRTLDVTDHRAFQAVVADVVRTSGGLDFLVNNAGFLLPGPVAELESTDLRRQFEVNVFAAVAGARAAIGHMARAGRGRIVNVGSPSGILTTPFAGAYCASKAALHSLSEALRIEVAPLGIEVIVVQPGAVASSLGDNASPFLERYRGPTSRYRSVAHAIERRAFYAQRRPMPVDVFAHRLAAAITRRRAPRTVRIGSEAIWMPLVSALVPGALMDRILGRTFDLEDLEVGGREP